MSPEISYGNESDLKTGPVLALIGAENRQESFETYFYPLSIPISCGSFHKETGERSEGCKVIEMEVIDEARARERYRRFLAVWKE